MIVSTRTRARLAMVAAILFSLASAAGLSWAFTGQIAHSRELRAQEYELERAVAAAQERHLLLLEVEKRVMTDEFVVDWARESLVWVEEGETTIVFVDPPAAPQVAPEPIVEYPELVDKPLWLEIFELIVGR